MNDSISELSEFWEYISTIVCLFIHSLVHLFIHSDMYVCMYVCIYLFIESINRGGAEREEERIPSTLLTQSAVPDVGLELMNHEIMT